jgi:hypothetical protein
MCELTAGHTKQACASVGGVKQVDVYNIENRNTYTEASGAISAIDMLTGKQAWRITPDMASIVVTETPTRSRENNSLFYAQTVAITVKDNTAETRALVDLISKGFIGLIGEGEDGENFHYGLVNGMTVETAEITTGQNYEDLNGATINLIGKEKSIAPSITDALITPLLSPA